MNPIVTTLRIVLPMVIILLLVAFSSVAYFAYSSAQNIEISFEHEAVISLHEPLRISFTHSILDEGYREKISISPKTNVLVAWKEDNTVLELTPQSIWKPETQYTLTIPEGKATNYASFQEISFSFQTVSYPKVESFWPENGAKDVLVGIEDPLIVQLDRNAGDFWIDFSLSPEGSVIYQNNDNRSRFEILPENTFKEGALYDVTVFAYPADNVDPLYRKELTTFSFETLPPKPKEWSKDMTERLAQAKRFTRAQIQEGKYIDINIDAQIMSIFENGNLIDSFMVSSGLPGMDTPKGTFAIHNQHPRPWSRQYELFMPYWMAITPDGKYGIHELPEWPGGYKEGENHLGTPVSHGCVRLGVGSAKRVYEWAEIGTPVVIY